MSHNTDIMIYIISLLKEKGIKQINRLRLEQIIDFYKSDSKCHDYFENFEHDMDGIFLSLIKQKILIPGDDYTNYKFTDNPMALGSKNIQYIRKHYSKEAYIFDRLVDNYDSVPVVNMIPNMPKLKEEEKPKEIFKEIQVSEETQIPKINKQPISDVHQFFLVFLSLLLTHYGVNDFEEGIFEEAFQINFKNQELFYHWLEAIMQRDLPHKDLNQMWTAFLWTSTKDNNDKWNQDLSNHSELERKDGVGMSFTNYLTLEQCQNVLETYDEEDINKVDSLVNIYCSKMDLGKSL